MSRARLSYQPRLPLPNTVALYHGSDAIYTATPLAGSRRMTAVLCQEGWPANRKRGQHARRVLGPHGLAPTPAGRIRLTGSPVLVTRDDDGGFQPRVGDRHHVGTAPGRVTLPGGGVGPGLPGGPGNGRRSCADRLSRRRWGGPWSRRSRSSGIATRGALHQPAGHGHSRRRGRADQQGRAGAGLGQRLHRAVLAEPAVGSGVPA